MVLVVKDPPASGGARGERVPISGLEDPLEEKMAVFLLGCSYIHGVKESDTTGD